MIIEQSFEAGIAEKNVPSPGSSPSPWNRRAPRQAR